MPIQAESSILVWHSCDTNEVLQKVSSSIDGLSQSNAQQRLHKFGHNRLRPVKKKGALLRFLVQFHNVLIYVLLVAGIVTALLGHWVDSGVIFGVV